MRSGAGLRWVAKRPGRLWTALIGPAVGAFVVSSCASSPAPTVDAAEYRTQLAALCTTASAERSALEQPVDPSTVAEFARQIADSLSSEADSARALRTPDDLDADHRAFVQNTADQAARWKSLAATAPDDAAAFGALQTEILQLTLGRNELAVEMGIDECRSSPP